MGSLGQEVDMSEQSPLTSLAQLEALRLLWEWWDARPPGRFRRTAAATVTDVLVLPPGYTPAHLDERLAEAS
jgi:hypothetical protein